MCVLAVCAHWSMKNCTGWFVCVSVYRRVCVPSISCRLTVVATSALGTRFQSVLGCGQHIHPIVNKIRALLQHLLRQQQRTILQLKRNTNACDADCNVPVRIIFLRMRTGHRNRVGHCVQTTRKSANIVASVSDWSVTAHQLRWCVNGITCLSFC